MRKQYKASAYWLYIVVICVTYFHKLY